MSARERAAAGTQRAGSGEYTYVGTRTPLGPVVHVADGDAPPRRLRHLVRHSPDTLDWGVDSPGAADLALSILADALGDPVRAEQLAPPFRFHVIAGLPRARFWLSRAAVLRWVQEQPVGAGPGSTAGGTATAAGAGGADAATGPAPVAPARPEAAPSGRGQTNGRPRPG